mmetsp:Transcript_15743/g.15132  ORF Transcript_15743/g.15132 Transcript_15743/m.15132 type:complete len:204 (+) Transcript_15743:917-1528(+)
MGPVNFIGLSNVHALAMFPIVLIGILLLGLIIVVTLVSSINIASKNATCVFSIMAVSVGSFPILVILSDRKMLSSEMPVDIDGTHTLHKVGVRIWRATFHIKFSLISNSNVGAGLLSRSKSKSGIVEFEGVDLIDNALYVGEFYFCPATNVHIFIEYFTSAHGICFHRSSNQNIVDFSLLVGKDCSRDTQRDRHSGKNSRRDS